MESKLIPELIDEVKQVGGTEKCPVCDGDGEVEWEFESYTKEDSCPKCDGGGFKDEVKKIQTGNKIADNESPFKMYGTGYFYKELRRLIDACKAAGIENIKQVRADKRTANIFDCSLFTIYVMPANVYDDGDRVKILF